MPETQPRHDSKTRILDAAMQVIRSKGYSAATVDDVCAALDPDRVVGDRDVAVRRHDVDDPGIEVQLRLDRAHRQIVDAELNIERLPFQ